MVSVYNLDLAHQELAMLVPGVHGSIASTGMPGTGPFHGRQQSISTQKGTGLTMSYLEKDLCTL